MASTSMCKRDCRQLTDTTVTNHLEARDEQGPVRKKMAPIPSDTDPAKTSRIHSKQLSTYSITLGNCAECDVKLQPGVEFFMFECFIHALCKRCLLSNLDMNEKEGCTECISFQLQDEENTQPNKTRNTLPIIPLADGKSTIVGASSMNYSYPTQYKVDVLPKKDHVLKRRLSVNHPIGSLLNTSHKDTIIGCGFDTPTLTIFTTEGIRTIHYLTEGNLIKSGTYIHSDTFLICVEYVNDDGYMFHKKKSLFKLFVIHLDVTSLSPRTIEPFPLPLLYKYIERPIQIYNICRQRYGVLYQRIIIDQEGKTQKKNKICILTLESILLPEVTEPHTVSSNIIWGRRMVDLEESDGDVRNEVCEDGRRFALAEYEKELVHIYSRTGMFRYSMDMEWYDHDEPMEPVTWKYPPKLICARNDGFGLIGNNCVVRSYNTNYDFDSDFYNNDFDSIVNGFENNYSDSDSDNHSVPSYEHDSDSDSDNNNFNSNTLHDDCNEIYDSDNESVTSYDNGLSSDSDDSNVLRSENNYSDSYSDNHDVPSYANDCDSNFNNYNSNSDNDDAADDDYYYDDDDDDDHYHHDDDDHHDEFSKWEILYNETGYSESTALSESYFWCVCRNVNVDIYEID